MMTPMRQMKMATMTFDIQAAVTNAINKRLTNYENRLLNAPETADALKAKYDAILKTIEEGFAYSQLRPKAVQLLLDAFSTFERWGYWTEYISFSETALTLTLPAEQQVLLYAHLGHMNDLNRNFDDSLRYLNLGLALAEKHQLKNCFGLLHHRLMNTHLGRDEPQIAQEHGLQALTYLAGTPSTTLAAAYDSLGRVYTRLNNSTMAEKYFWDALLIWGSLNDYKHMARSYINLGHLFFRGNKLAEAQKCFESALDVLGNLSAILDELNARNGLGIVHYANDDFDGAVTIFREAVSKLDQELGDKVGWYSLTGSLVHNLGNARLAKGDIQQAMVALRRARTFWQQANNRLEMANTVGTLAEAYQANKEWETAVTHYDEALALLTNYPDHPWAARLANNFSRAKKICAEQLETPKE
ncbi:MAG: tetratricopeptide repeat protein [Chloroflexota bacterium]